MSPNTPDAKNNINKCNAATGRGANKLPVAAKLIDKFRCFSKLHTKLLKELLGINACR